MLYYRPIITGNKNSNPSIGGASDARFGSACETRTGGPTAAPGVPFEHLEEMLNSISRTSIAHEPHERPDRVYVHMENVESRSIRRVGYNPKTQQLVIQFYDSLPGLRTVYSPVPQEIFEGLMKADSMGRFLEENIRYNYDFSLVNEKNLVDPDGGGDEGAAG